MALRAEYAVDPSVLVLCKSHIVDICFLRAGIFKEDRPVPKPETVKPAVALRDSEKRLAVRPLDPGNEVILSIQADCTGIQHRIYPEPLLEERIRSRIKVIPPGQRNR